MSDELVYNGPEYPTKAYGSIPAFNSYKEEADFWDTHDITDFTKETQIVSFCETKKETIHSATIPTTDFDSHHSHRRRTH